MSFDQFGFSKDILRTVRKAGYEHPTPIQELAMPKIMKGCDVTGIAQTGTGKTAAFVLPAIQMILDQKADAKDGCMVLILVPTRELAIQIMKNIRVYADGLPIRAAAVHGGVDEALQLKAIKRGVHFIVATPGRLLDLMERHRVDFGRLATLVLDEADRMLDMGFIDAIESIIDELPKRRRTLMFSATLSKKVESLAKRYQYKPQVVEVGGRSNPADTVDQCVYKVSERLKGPHLLELLKKVEFTRVLVFVKTKSGANVLTQYLMEHGVKASRLHSSRSQEQRNESLQAFKDGSIQVLVATDLAARGIDVIGVSHVINYDFPVNPDDYVHRIGRTGRAKLAGVAISLVPESDQNVLEHLELTIGMRLPQKKLRGFDYHGRDQKGVSLVPKAKQDWRKRTREQQSKQNTKGRPANKRPKDSQSRQKKRGK